MKAKIILTKKQREIIYTLVKYRNCIIMFDYWLTGGHGIKFDGRSVEALRRKDIIQNGKLTELGKSLAI